MCGRDSSKNETEHHEHLDGVKKAAANPTAN